MVNIHPCGARHVRLGRRVIESNCWTWGRDGNSCWCRSGHSQLTVATELVVSLKNHHTDHRAAGCVCCDCKTYTQELLIEKPLMEKKAKLNAPLFCTHIRWTSRFANRMCSVDPECIQHSRFPKSEASVLFDLTTKSVKKLVIEPPATVVLGLCFQLLFMMSFSTLRSLRWS